MALPSTTSQHLVPATSSSPPSTTRSRTQLPQARSPAVLVSELADRWLIAGLTTSRRRLDGVARVSVPHPYAVGLTGPGYLWGNRLHGIRKDDVLRRIGHAHAALAHRIADTHQMSEEARLALLRAFGVMLPEHPEAC